jgi:uncharacterized protein YcfL
MKKLIFLFIISLMISSCNSQTDLETLKFDTDVSLIIKDTTKFEKGNDIIFPFLSYKTSKISDYSFGKLSLTNYNIKDTAKNSLITYTSDLSLFVDNYKSNRLAGFAIRIKKENEGNDLFNYIKTKLGKPLMENIYNKDNIVQNRFLWDDKKGNQLVYITQNTNSFSDDKNSFVATELAVFKRNMTLKPDENNDPEGIKKLLEENPKAFDLIEILKSRFN